MQPNLYTTQALIPKIFIIACKEGILLMPNGNPIAEARDNADTESDVDILIILEKIGTYSDEIARTSKLVSELSLKYDKTISRVFVSWHDWEEKETPWTSELSSASLRNWNDGIMGSGLPSGL